MERATIEFDVSAEMSDGLTLRADVLRPGLGDGPWPVLLVRTPYGKRISGTWELVDPLAVLARGFMVVLQDCRGRGSSEGEFRPWLHEASDGADTIAWAATMRGSSGDVVMGGPSYLGNVQWMAATMAPPALRAIAPMHTWSDAYDGLFRRGGAEELGLSVSWGLLTGIETVIRRNLDDPDRLGPAVANIIADMDGLAAGGYRELPAAAHPALARNHVTSVGNQEVLQDTALADACTIAGKYDQVQVPSLCIAGWYDIFVQGVLDSYTEMARRQPGSRLIVGPWTHQQQSPMQGEVNFGFAAGKALIGLQRSLVDRQVDWFEQQLAGAAAEATDGPLVTIFVMGANEWRDEPAWPLARAVDTEYYLHGGGLFDSAAPKPDVSRYAYDPADPAPTVGGGLVMAVEYPSGPFDQQRVESRDDVLTFTSEPLPEDIEVTGRVRAVLFVDTDCVSTDWVVRLCDVDEHGVSRNLTDGISRITHVPGELTEVNVDLWSTSNVFLAGHRIRVHVTSSNFPRWDRNLNTGEPPAVGTSMRIAHQRVHHGPDSPSRVELPIVAR